MNEAKLRYGMAVASTPFFSSFLFFSIQLILISPTWMGLAVGAFGSLIAWFMMWIGFLIIIEHGEIKKKQSGVSLEK